MEFANQAIHFDSEAPGGDSLVVRKVAGFEQLSGLFRFELELLSSNKALDLEAIVAAPARLGLKQSVQMGGGGVGTRKRLFAGVLTTFEQHEEGQGWVLYRATLVPQVWHLTQFFRSRIFQTRSAPQIVKALLEEQGLAASAPSAPGKQGVFGAFHFSPELTKAMEKPTPDQASYPLRDYVVQYEENDWDFVSRWLEHEGIYYFFENSTEGRERISFGDLSTACEAVEKNPEEATYAYRPQGGASELGSTDEELIVSFLCKQRRAPKEVKLNDYNWRDALRLETKQTVHDKGVGLHTQYNDHFKYKPQGDALARVRKEEFLCRTKLFHGAGTCRAFRPGKTFSLRDHYRADWNRSYLIVGVTHQAEQTINLEAATITGASYSNEFTAIPADVPFRPERLTDWPSIKGAMHAKVDAAEGKEYADLDDGCYTVRIPYDPHYDDESAEGRKPGAASRRVRMAQPFSGMDAGFHFPLRKGTEVILTHIDGDPDRPIIAGAVPNAETGNVGSTGDESRNRIVSNSGNRFEIHDQTGSTGFLFVDTTAGVVSDRRNRLVTEQVGGAPPPEAGGGGAALPPAAGSAAEGREALAPESERAQPKSAAEAAALLGRPLTEPAPAGGSELPGPGLGMPAVAGESVEGDSYSTVADAVTAFNSGAAAQALATSLYVGGGGTVTWSDAELDTIFKKLLDKFEQNASSFSTGALGSDSANPQIDRNAGDNAFDAFDGIGEAFTGDHHKNKQSAEGGGASKKTAFLAAVNNFTGKAFGSQLKINLGDTALINRGLYNYTFGDVSNDISYGTGGYGFHEENGATISESYQYGDAASKSFTYGDSSSHEEVTGDATSYSQTMGDHNETSFFFGTKVSFDLMLAAESSSSISLAAVDENSLAVGLKGGLNLFIGGEIAVDLQLAAYLKLTMAVVPGLEIKLAPDWGQVTLPHKEEIDVGKLQIALNQTKTILMDTTSAVKANNAVLNETNAALSKTLATVTNTDLTAEQQIATLSDTNAALSTKTAALSANESALSKSVQSASMASLSGAHIIS